MIQKYIVWLIDGSFFEIEAKSEREAQQKVCRKLMISDSDIDIVELVVDSTDE